MAIKVKLHKHLFEAENKGNANNAQESTPSNAQIAAEMSYAIANMLTGIMFLGNDKSKKTWSTHLKQLSKKQEIQAAIEQCFNAANKIMTADIKALDMKAVETYTQMVISMLNKCAEEIAELGKQTPQEGNQGEKKGGQQ